MLQRIREFAAALFQRSRRFKLAVFGSLYIFAASLVETKLNLPPGGEGDIWQRGILVMLCVTALSIPWRLYNERADKVGPRRDALGFLIFIIGWRLLEGLPLTPYCFMAAGGILAASATATLYYCDVPEGRDRVFPWLFLSLVKSLGIGLLILVLLSICYLGFQFLVMPVGIQWLGCIFVFAFGVVGFLTFLSYIPLPEEEIPEVPGFTTLWRRVLLPFFGLLLLILYLYMGKIAWVRAMPVGTMNWFASAATAVYALLYFSFGDLSQRWFRKVFLLGGLLLIPVLLVQGIGVQMRWSAYGATSLRYLSLVCSAYGVCILAAGLVGMKPRKLFGLGAVLALLVTVTPLNAIDFPAQLQYSQLRENLLQGQMLVDGQLQANPAISVQRADRIYSAWEYLKGNPGSWRYPLVKEVEASGLLASLPNNRQQTHLRYAYNAGSFPVKDYSRVYILDPAKIQDGKLTYTQENGQLATYDVTAFVDRLYQLYPNGGEIPLKDMTWMIDEHRMFYFTFVGGQEKSFTGTKPGVIAVRGLVLER